MVLFALLFFLGSGSALTFDESIFKDYEAGVLTDMEKFPSELTNKSKLDRFTFYVDKFLQSTNSIQRLEQEVCLLRK